MKRSKINKEINKSRTEFDLSDWIQKGVMVLGIKDIAVF